MPNVIGPLTIAELTNRKYSDLFSLQFASAPVLVSGETSTLSGLSQFCVLLGEALGRRKLMDLLYILAPYKAHGPDRFARVLDNWGIIDRAKNSSTSLNLLQRHSKSLRRPWRLFEQHREAFAAVLGDTSEARSLIPVLVWAKDTFGRRAWRFDGLDEDLEAKLKALLGGALASTKDQERRLDTVAGLVTLPYFYEELHLDWPAWKPLEPEGKSNYVGLASVPMMALLSRGRLMEAPLISAVEALFADSAP